MIKYLLLICWGMMRLEGARISSILKGVGHLGSSTVTADPYEWELQRNPVSLNSCYAVPEKTLAPIETVKDTECVGFNVPSSKCRGGLPFYRFAGGPAGCVDCLDASRCQMMCLSKGMDAAAIVLGQSGVPSECRCGATKQNLSVWGLLRSKVGEQINFGPVHSLLPPSPLSAVASTDPRCQMFVYLYKDARETNGGIPSQFLDVTMSDDYYIRQIVSGMKDPGDVEDSSVSEGERVHAAVRDRLQLWLKSNPTNRVPRDEIFVEQVASERSRSSSAACQSVDEPFTCWDSAVDSVLAKNGWRQTNSNGDFTSEYMTMMMTVPYKSWQGLFAGSGSMAVSDVSYQKSGFCSTTANANQCPITCGQCELYDRGPRTASMYTTWAATNTDPQTGIVTIPVVIESGNQYVTETAKGMIREAMKVWAAVTCVNFQEVSSVPNSQRYVLVTAETDSTGKPSGCIADPVGMPESPSSPTRISVGGCSENKKPLGSVIHEFAHVLGLVHTQMRPDRDDFIRMNPMMVKSGFEPNFFLAPYAFDGAQGSYSEYDYGSIMHYTRTQAANVEKYVASSDDWSGTFKLVKPLAAGVALGQRDAVSVLDIAEVNALYSCKSVLANAAHSETPLGSVGEVTTTTTTSPSREGGVVTTALPSGVTTTGSPTTRGSITTTTSPTTRTTTLPPVWIGWEDDVAHIGSAIDQVVQSTAINLSMHQLDTLQTILSQEKEVYQLFQKALATSSIPTSWRHTIVEIASNILVLVADSKDGVTRFVAGKNPSQEAILDEAAIENLDRAVELTKTLYAKLTAYVQTIPGAISAHDAVDIRHPSPSETVVVFG